MGVLLMDRTVVKRRRSGAARGPMRRLPRPVRILIFGMLTVAAAGVAIRIPEISTWEPKDVMALVALTIAICVSEQFPLEIRYRTENLYLGLTDSMWAAALLLAKPGILTLSVALGVYVGLKLRGVAPHKIAFNLGQYILAVTVAEAVFELISRGSNTMSSQALVALPVAMAVYAVVSTLLVTLVVSLAERKPFLEVLLPPLPVNALHYAGNIALGILGAMAWTISPWGVLLIGFPLAVFYTAYRTMVRSLREGDRLRELIVENASDGIFVASTDCSIVSWNPAMERITGLTADDVIGKNWRAILSPSSDGTPGDADTPCQAPGDAWFAPIARRDGTKGWLLCSSNTIRGRDGKVKATVIVVHDVSAEREAEQLKADFVATISHELRTPLTPLKGFLSSLIHGTIDDKTDARNEYYQIMLRQANRLERLVTELLEVSRIESSNALGSTEPVDLCAPVIEQIRTFTEEHPGRNIVLRAPEEQIFVDADASRVGLVVSNLLANALKYSPTDKPVKVSLGLDDHHATITVRDEGPGIPLSEQERIFDRFYQIENHLTRPNGGVGLGLYICRRLIEGMNGRLWVDSRPGHGSTFSFSLPLADMPVRAWRS